MRIYFGSPRGVNYSFVLNEELLDALRVKLCYAPVNTRWHVLVIVSRLCLNITEPNAVEDDDDDDDEVKTRCERQRGSGGRRFITSKGRLASPRRKTKPAITVIPSAR